MLSPKAASFHFVLTIPLSVDKIQNNIGSDHQQIEHVNVQHNVTAVEYLVGNTEDIPDKDRQRKNDALPLRTFHANGLDYTDRPGDSKAKQHSHLKYAQFTSPLCTKHSIFDGAPYLYLLYSCNSHKSTL